MLHTPPAKRSKPLARTNVTLPEDLLRQVDELAGPRGRSKFVADAVAWKVKRERLRRALDATRGAAVGTPDYMGPEESYRWIRSMREQDTDDE
jgi:Arc/MetJ family transcription regulator